MMHLEGVSLDSSPMSFLVGVNVLQWMPSVNNPETERVDLE